MKVGTAVLVRNIRGIIDDNAVHEIDDTGVTINGSVGVRCYPLVIPMFNVQETEKHVNCIFCLAGDEIP